MAYEARVVEAHLEGYARIPKGLSAQASAIVHRLRGAALDEPLQPDLQRRLLRAEAEQVRTLLSFAGLPRSRRALCEAQVKRMLRAGDGEAELAYAGTRHFGAELDGLSAGGAGR